MYKRNSNETVHSMLTKQKFIAILAARFIYKTMHVGRSFGSHTYVQCLGPIRTSNVWVLQVLHVRPMFGSHTYVQCLGPTRTFNVWVPHVRPMFGSYTYVQCLGDTRTSNVWVPHVRPMFGSHRYVQCLGPTHTYARLMFGTHTTLVLLLWAMVWWCKVMINNRLCNAVSSFMWAGCIHVKHVHTQTRTGSPW